MHPSAACLVRIVPRSALKVTPRTKIVGLASQREELQHPTLIDIMVQRREAAGTRWPANLRIEPVVKKEALGLVHGPFRTVMKRILKET